jgi:hypothetical protein
MVSKLLHEEKTTTHETLNWSWVMGSRGDREPKKPFLELTKIGSKDVLYINDDWVFVDSISGIECRTQTHLRGACGEWIERLTVIHLEGTELIFSGKFNKLIYDFLWRNCGGN